MDGLGNIRFELESRVSGTTIITTYNGWMAAEADGPKLLGAIWVLRVAYDGTIRGLEPGVTRLGEATITRVGRLLMIEGATLDIVRGTLNAVFRMHPGDGES